MSAGQPDWGKLNQMNRLPKEARGKIPYLAQLDVAEKRIKDLEEENARLRAGGAIDPKVSPAPGDDPDTTQLKCEKCGIMIGGKTETATKIQMTKHVNKVHPV